MKQAKAFEVIECRGTPYEIGRQWGEGCRDDIIKSLETNLSGLNLGYGAGREEVLANAMKFLPRVREFDPDLTEMLRGQAEGAGVSFEEAFTLRCICELMFYYNQIRAMCTSFAAGGEATADGRTILGQTIDWAPGTPLSLLKIHHENGLVQLALNVGGFVEYTLNSSGYGICANATFGRDYMGNIPVGCYIPRASRQKSISEAMDILRQAARGVGYYHLAGADGEMMGIESVHNDFEVIRPERGILLHTNHYLVERFKEGDMAPVFIRDSFSRLERFRTLIDKHCGSISPELMMEIFSDHENYPHAICTHPDSSSQIQSQTLAAFIMIPAEKAMYISYGNPCCHEFVRYCL